VWATRCRSGEFVCVLWLPTPSRTQGRDCVFGATSFPARPDRLHSVASQNTGKRAGALQGLYKFPSVTAAAASGLDDAILGNLRGRRRCRHHMPPHGAGIRCRSDTAPGRCAGGHWRDRAVAECEAGWGHREVFPARHTFVPRACWSASWDRVERPRVPIPLQSHTQRRDHRPELAR